MICPPCAAAADQSTADSSVIVTGHGTPVRITNGGGHDPAICRDTNIQPRGCPCQHGPIGTATSEGNHDA